MIKAIPIFPCSDITTQIEFYKYLGFELVGQYTRSYLIMKSGELEFHFYGEKRVLPKDNPSMCNILTDNLDELHNTFTTGLKANIGKIPRSGFPKITKIRELSEDRRFTLTDPSGNTFYITSPKQFGSKTFFRDLSDMQYSKDFAILYDLIYSKEDLVVANNMLQNLLKILENLEDLDKAKLILLALEIKIGLALPYDDSEITSLISVNKGKKNWNLIEQKLLEICRQEP